MGKILLFKPDVRVGISHKPDTTQVKGPTALEEWRKLSPPKHYVVPVNDVPNVSKCVVLDNISNGSIQPNTVPSSILRSGSNGTLPFDEQMFLERIRTKLKLDTSHTEDGLVKLQLRLKGESEPISEVVLGEKHGSLRLSFLRITKHLHPLKGWVKFVSGLSGALSNLQRKR